MQVAYALCQPYADPQDAQAAAVGQKQIFITFSLTLVISESLLGPGNNDRVGILLILVTCWVIVFEFMAELNAYREETWGLAPIEQVIWPKKNEGWRSKGKALAGGGEEQSPVLYSCYGML